MLVNRCVVLGGVLIFASGCFVDAIWQTEQRVVVHFSDRATSQPVAGARISCQSPKDESYWFQSDENGVLTDYAGRAELRLQTSTIHCSAESRKSWLDPMRDQVTGKEARLEISSPHLNETVQTVLTSGLQTDGERVTVNVISISPAVEQRPERHQGNSKSEGLQVMIHSGFEPSPSRLYVDHGGIVRLIQALGYNASKYSFEWDHNSKGSSLRCWNYEHSSAVIFRMGERPRLIAEKTRVYLDDDDHPIAWEAGGTKITFRSGETLDLPRFALFSRAQFFCLDGDRKYVNSAHRWIGRAQVRAVNQPGTPLATSQLSWLIEGLYARRGALYIIARENTDRLRNNLECEEYAIKDSGLDFTRRFEIKCPAKIGGVNFVPRDLDPTTGSLVLTYRHDMPFGATVWYIYEVDSGRYRRIGNRPAYVGFLDRQVFDRALDEIKELPDVSAKQPADPDRSGMGIREEHK